MASRELSILVTAKNMASRVLGTVKGDINGLNGAASRASSNIGRNLALAGTAVAAGIAVQVKAGVDSLVELERVENLTAAALKSTGNLARQSVDGIRARSEAMEGLTGVDDKAIQNAQNLLLTFTGITEDGFEPTLEAALNLNAALGGDDESLQGVLLQVAKAVNDPIRGMTALRRSGVSFTKAEQDQVKALVEANNLMGAQEVVLGALQTQFGGAAEAANQGATRAQRRWADAVEDIQKSLATGFLPLIERVSGKMTELIADPAFLPMIEGFGQGIADAFDDAIDFAETVDWGAVGSAFKTMGTGARTVMDAFLGAPPWLQTAILTGWGLNKLTGGVVGSLVGELGKGLIRGVLNINAAVVNVKGAVVNKPGGKLPFLGPVGAVALPLMLSGSNSGLEPGVQERQEITRLWQQGLLTDEQYQTMFKLSNEGIDVNLPSDPSLPHADPRGRGNAPIGQYDPKNMGGRPVTATLPNTAMAPVTTALAPLRELPSIRSAQQALHAKQSEALAAARGQSGILAQIRDKRGIVNVTANFSPYLSFSTTQLLRTTTSYRMSTNTSGI